MSISEDLFAVIEDRSHPDYSLALNCLWDYYLDSIEHVEWRRLLIDARPYLFDHQLDGRSDLRLRFLKAKRTKDSAELFTLLSGACLFDSVTAAAGQEFLDNVSWCNEFLWMVTHHFGGEDQTSVAKQRFDSARQPTR